MEKMKTTITYGQAVDSINSAIIDFKNGVELSAETIADITYAVNNDLQIRDYLIGLPQFNSLFICSGFLEELADKVSLSERYAFDTVNAMYHYEMENFNTCKTLVEFAENSNSDYPLLKLIKRVISAGWPSSSFTTMRDELAPKVLDGIHSNLNYEIVEK